MHRHLLLPIFSTQHISQVLTQLSRQIFRRVSGIEFRKPTPTMHCTQKTKGAFGGADGVIGAFNSFSF